MYTTESGQCCEVVCVVCVYTEPSQTVEPGFMIMCKWGARVSSHGTVNAVIVVREKRERSTDRSLFCTYSVEVVEVVW